MKAWLLVAIGLMGPTAVEAQMDHGKGDGAGAMAAVRPLYERVKRLFTRSAEMMPEDKYGFKPIAEVRTFAQQLGHVANENYLFCAAALGEANPNQTDFEKTTAKAELIKAVAASFGYCDPVYRMADAKALEETSFEGSKGSRLWVATFNVTHDSEHYGNLVVYFRLNGMVPPSSQRGQ